MWTDLLRTSDYNTQTARKMGRTLHFGNELRCVITGFIAGSNQYKGVARVERTYPFTDALSGGTYNLNPDATFSHNTRYGNEVAISQDCNHAFVLSYALRKIYYYKWSEQPEGYQIKQVLDRWTARDRGKRVDGSTHWRYMKLVETCNVSSAQPHGTYSGIYPDGLTVCPNGEELEAVRLRRHGRLRVRRGAAPPKEFGYVNPLPTAAPSLVPMPSPPPKPPAPHRRRHRPTCATASFIQRGVPTRTGTRST